MSSSQSQSMFGSQRRADFSAVQGGKGMSAQRCLSVLVRTLPPVEGLKSLDTF